MIHIKSILLTLWLFPVSIQSSAQPDNCLHHEITKNSVELVSFCADYNTLYHKELLYYFKLIAGFNSRDTITFISVDTSLAHFVEQQLPSQLLILNKEKRSQGSSYPDIERYLHHYTRQYFGSIDKEGEPVILINFFWLIDRDAKFNRKEPHSWDDGCSYFWKVKYRINTRTFFDLAINGKA